MSVDRPYSLSENSTAGFTISPHIAAIVQTDPYVDLYHYYRRRTLAEVPRHFSFFYFFWQTGALRFLRTLTSCASLAMASLPPPTARRRPFWGNALVSQIMGDSPPARFHRGGVDLHNNSPGRFEGGFAATTWGNRHCLYRHPRPFCACSGATRLLPAPWATPHPGFLFGL